LKRSLAISLVALTGLWPSGAAHADDKRKIAVLEYRSGARGAPDIGARLASELARSSVFEVMEPSEAHRRFGAALDAEVARCVGAPSCVAQLARRLDADEALLVGVSQLGDLVLALQRVDAHRGVALSRLAESLPAEHTPDSIELVDWLHQLFPAEAFHRYGSIRIISDVDEAQVSINGTRSGMTPLGRALHVAAPGSYRVRVDKPGFLPFQARIEVPPDATVEVRATLSQRAGPTPWYKRWYVWAIVGGAAAATGAGLAAYYGTRVDQTPHGYVIPPPTK
jgi:hypothetical protein